MNAKAREDVTRGACGLVEARAAEWRQAMSNVGGPCPTCNATGEVSNPMTFNGMDTCWTCAGTGKVNPPRRALP